MRIDSKTFGNRNIPSHYGDIPKECRAVRESAGIIDLSHWTKISITGADRKGFLHGMTTNEVTKLNPGEGNYALFLTPHGRILGDFFLFDQGEELLLLGRESIHEPVWNGLNKYIITEDVRLIDRSEEFMLFSIQGPWSLDLLSSRLTEGSLPEKEYCHQSIRLSGIPCLGIRQSHTGEIGFDIPAKADDAESLWSILLQAGATPVGQEALEILRVEAGIPIHGHELNADVFPQEARLDHAVSYTKGCYIGQETVARLHFRGHVNRELTGFVLETNAPPEPPLMLTQDEKNVGLITSTVYSHALSQVIALGFLRCELREAGTEVTACRDAQTLRAVIYTLPFVE